jgi:hypothetical protein
MTAYHPELDDHGLPVALKTPTTGSPLSARRHADETATAILGERRAPQTQCHADARMK